MRSRARLLHRLRRERRRRSPASSADATSPWSTRRSTARLLTGVKLSGATMKRFRHNDLEQLEKVLSVLPPEAAKGIIVDGVYSMGGDTSPLDRMVGAAAGTPRTRSCSTTKPTASVSSASAGPRRRGALRRARRRRPRDAHVLQDARFVRRRARRAGRGDRAAQAHVRHVDLHRVEHARVGRRGAGGAAHPAGRARPPGTAARAGRGVPLDAEQPRRADEPVPRARSSRSRW